MTGTWTSKACRGLAALIASGSVQADNLTLSGDARLTGTVRSIDAAGVVELASPLSPEPLLLKAGVVSKVEFTTASADPTPPSALIELTNGDVLPVTVGSLDDGHLNVVTADAGPLAIPRSAIKSLQLGIHKRNVIYAGPRNLEEWTRDRDTGKNWTFANGELTANGPAMAAMEFQMPSQFVLKFTLKWEARPNFKITFADPLTPKAEMVDRYYLQFNDGGLEVKREASEGQHFRPVIVLPRTPDQYPSNQLDVEIRVDRKSSRLLLFLNGQPEAAVIDPTSDAPKGNGVIIVNSAANGPTQRVSNIELSEFDDARARHRAENRGDTKTDSLISRDEDRWGGKLTGIRNGPDGAVFLFKSDFQEEPLELAENDVSTIFFAATAGAPAAPPAEESLALRLRGDGLLRVTSCVFSEDNVTAVHPLLGDLKIQRAGVAALERPDAKPEADPEE